MDARGHENAGMRRRWPVISLSREAITAKVVRVCLLLLLAVSPEAGCGSSASKVCTPGQSVACVGVGACQGGQLCKADGTGYEACLCGGGAGSGGSSGGLGGGGSNGSAGSVGGAGGAGGQGGSSGLSGSGGAGGITGTGGTGQDAGGNDAVNSDAATDASSDTGAADAGTCPSYATSTIAAMRTAGVNGCFKFVNVVSIGLAPSATSPRLFVQDAGGGGYSAMMMTCSTTMATHLCPVASSVAAITDGRSVTVTGSYVKSSTTHVEEFFLDSISDIGVGSTPAAAAANLAQIERSSTAYDLAFQHVTTTLSGPGAGLVMYDWTPSEFVFTGAAACPYQKGGFGMIPQSINAGPGAACADGTSQPAGQVVPNGAEVLIGTDFYKGFTISSDCRCAKTYAFVIPTVSSTLSGSIDGILVFDSAPGASAGFFYVAPKTNSAAPISSTIAGP